MGLNKTDEFCLNFTSEKYYLLFSEFLEVEYSFQGDPMQVFIIKRNDTAPTLSAVLLNNNDEPVELTSLNEIKFIMKERFFTSLETEELKVQNSVNVSLAPQNDPRTRGKFQYNWSPEDTDTEGEYTGEFQITLNGVECENAETFRLEDGMDLDLSIDGGTTQNFVFTTADFANIGAATAEEVAAVINATIAGGQTTVSDSGKRLLIQTLDKSTSGSVQVLGGTANSILLFDPSLSQNRRISLPYYGILIRVVADLDEN